MCDKDKFINTTGGIGYWVKRARHSAGWSIQRLGEALGVPATEVVLIEGGVVCRLDLLVRIAAVLLVDAVYLQTGIRYVTEEEIKAFHRRMRASGFTYADRMLIEMDVMTLPRDDR